MDQVITFTEVVAGVAIGAFGAFKGRSWARRRTSEDAVALEHNRAEIGMLERYQARTAKLELDIAEMARERNDAVIARGRAEYEAAVLRGQLDEARLRVNKLEADLAEVRTLLNRALFHPKDSDG